MTRMAGSLGSRSGRLGIVAGAMTFAWIAGASAQVASETQILEALKPKGVTRSLSLGAPPASPTAREDAAFIDSIATKPPRSLSIGEREKLAAVSAGKPTIDLEIPFDFNSSTIGPRAMPAVKNLGAALARPELKGGTFMIAGHTDGKGGDQFNQSLSERRAEAVKRYIVANYGVPATSLVTVGYGKGRLKNAADPLADENRRVQATNISDVKSAGR